MSRFQIGVWIAAAVLLFWGVGAYNRLIRLRTAIVRGFTPIDEQLSTRHGLLAAQLEAVGGVLSHAGPRLDALRAACVQAEAARAHARTHPGAPGAITSLRLADDIVAEARARLPVQTVGGLDLTELNAGLSAADAALAFARGQFNTAVLDYNHAVRQIPTRLVAALFGFAPAGTL